MRPSDKLEQPNQTSSETSETKVTHEAQAGRQDLVDRQKNQIDALKGGARSGITDEFGKPLFFDDELTGQPETNPKPEQRQVADASYGGPDRVGERTAQNTAEVRSEVDYATYKASADRLVQQAQGHSRDNPYVVQENDSDPGKGNLVFYTETDGRSVAINTGNAVIPMSRRDADGKTIVFNQPVVTLDSKSEIYDLGNGKQAIVQFKPLGENSIRPDLSQTLPTDSYFIVLLDQKENKAYRYPAGASLNKYEDGSNLQKTLEILKGQGQPGGPAPDKAQEPVPDMPQPLPAPDMLYPVAGRNSGDDVRFGNRSEGKTLPEIPAKVVPESTGNIPRDRGGQGDDHDIIAPPIEEQRESLRDDMENSRTTVELTDEEETALDDIQDAIVSGDPAALAKALQKAAADPGIRIENVIAEADRSLEKSRGTIFTSVDGNKRCVSVGDSSDTFVTFDLDGSNPRVTKAAYRDPVTAQVLLANEKGDPGQTMQEINRRILNYHWTSKQFG